MYQKVVNNQIYTKYSKLRLYFVGFDHRLYLDYRVLPGISFGAPGHRRQTSDKPWVTDYLRQLIRQQRGLSFLVTLYFIVGSATK